jgi:hypothetical protein
MALKWRYVSLALIFILPLVVTFASRDAATETNSVELVCQLGSVTTPTQNNHIVLPVYMTNVHDSVAGFELWISSTYPEFVRFGVASVQGTVINAKFDTVGTRSKGFKYFEARIQDALHGQVKVVGLCDPDSPRVVKPIPPGSGVLLNLIMETNGTLGDSLCDSITVNVQLNRFQTSFSNSASQTIGCVYYWKVDTTYHNCAHYIGDSCTSWYDTTIVGRWWCNMDTTKRVLIDGLTSFSCCTCGDANGDGAIDISDAVYLISFIFSGGGAPGTCGGTNHGLGDANGDGAVDISDAVYLISRIFSGGPAPHCH